MGPPCIYIVSLWQAAVGDNGFFSLIKVGFKDGQTSKDASVSEAS